MNNTPAITAARDRLIDYFTRVDKATLRDVQQRGQNKQILLDAAAAYLHGELHMRDNAEVKAAVDAFDTYVFGYGVLEELINNPTISDIKVIAPDDVRIKRNGVRETSDITFTSAADINRYANYVAVKNQVSISDLNAIQTFTDKDSNSDFILRINISTSFVNSVSNAYIHIRKIPKHKMQLEDLVQAGMLSAATAKFLTNKAATASGILFCGKGGSGKTTLMNALLEQIPHDKSGLVIQENEELFSHTHPDLMFQHIVENRGEGKITYTLQDLARNGLLVDLDYFLIGEIKGGEALYMLNASYTGHRCWASVHGNSSEEAIDKLVDYIKYASDYSKEDATRMLATMQTIVYLKDFHVVEISEVVGYDESSHRLLYNTKKEDA